MGQVVLSVGDVRQVACLAAHSVKLYALVDSCRIVQLAAVWLPLHNCSIGFLAM